MGIQTTNFSNFTQQEYVENLKRLGIENHTDIVGKEVFYSRKTYGIHTVVEWDKKEPNIFLV